MARHSGAYKGDKRRKEVARLKKQEEKRQRRFSKVRDPEAPYPEDAVTENIENAGEKEN